MYAAFFACLGFVEQRDEKGVRTIPEQKLRFDEQACCVEHGGASRDNNHKPAPSRRKDRPIWSRYARWLWQQGRARFNRAPKAPAAPKAPSIRLVDSQPGEQGLDLDHAQFASSRASHALTSSIGKGMAGNVANFYSTLVVLIFCKE